MEFAFIYSTSIYRAPTICEETLTCYLASQSIVEKNKQTWLQIVVRTTGEKQSMDGEGLARGA